MARVEIAEDWGKIPEDKDIFIMLIPQCLEEDAKELFPSGYYYNQKIIVNRYIEKI